MIIAQLAVAFAAAWIYYMLAMFMTTYDGILSMLFQPIEGAIFAAIAVAVCLLLGLPIRLFSRLRQLWRSAWWLPLFFGAVGFVLMVMSWVLRVTVHDPATDMDVQTFQPAMALTGSFRCSPLCISGFRFPDFCAEFSLMITRGPNQALERTAACRAFTFPMIKTVLLKATFALGAGRSAWSR
jgi:hypothetical protein